jgi:VanZ family protein
MWAPALAYMAAIFYLSSLPNPLPGLRDAAGDKSLHALAYAGLAFLCSRAIAEEGLGWRMTLLLACVVATVYGASDEWHQSYVPGRGADLYDWFADAAGAAAGAGIHAVMAVICRIRPLQTSAHT